MQTLLRAMVLAALFASTAACDQAAEKTPGSIYAKVLADAATRECREKASSPNAGNQAQLQKICDCTRDKIVAARPGPLEPDSSRRTKLQEALDSCIAELGPAAAP